MACSIQADIEADRSALGTDNGVSVAVASAPGPCRAARGPEARCQDAGTTPGDSKTRANVAEGKAASERSRGLNGYTQAPRKHGDASDWGAPVEPADDNLLILQVRIGSQLLSETVVAYRIATGVCVYLGELANALDFAIDVDAERGRAEGWFLHEDRSFSLDIARREATVGGNQAEFDQARIEHHRAGICVDLTLLSSWFPIRFALDMPNAVLNLTASEPLPVEQRLARDQRRRKLRQHEVEDPAYPRVELPYKMWNWPVVDTFLDYGLVKAHEDSRPRHTGRYNVLAVGDLFKMSAELFLSGNTEDAVSTARARIGRKDPRGGLLGVLNAKEFALGDIATPQTPLVTRNMPGRGIEISSFPLDRLEEPDRVTLRGALPVGWEIELYRNGVLLDFRMSRSDGRYEFEDVPLLFGRNDLRLVSYGPQGQVREETQQLFVGSDIVGPGEDHFRLAINQQDRDLFTVSDDADDREGLGEARLVAQYERGIAENWSVAGSLFSLPFESGRRNYLALGLRTAFQSFALGMDVAANDDGGVAGQLSAQGFLGRVNLLAKHDQFFDYISERAEISGAGELRSRSLLRAHTVLPTGAGLHVPVSVEAQHELRGSGRHELSLSNRVSTAYRRLSLTNQLQFDRCFGGNEACDLVATGSLLLNYYLSPISIRGQMDYDLHPDPGPTNFLATVDWKIEEYFTARLTVSHHMRHRRTGFTLGLSKHFAGFALGANLGASNDGAYFAGISVNFSSGQDPWSKSVRASPLPMTARGNVAARVFIDDNRNGRFDAGDRPVPNVGFMADRRRTRARTDDGGAVLIEDLPVYQDIDISIAQRSLEDPFLVPAVEGVRIPTRPGAVAVLEFPLLETGEIDGTVYVERGGAVSEAANVELELLNENREIVQTTQSEFDGFYLFELVPLGRYEVRVSPEQLSRLSLTAAAGQVATLTGDRPVANGIDFTVAKAAPGAD